MSSNSIEKKITIAGLLTWLIGSLFFLYEFFLRTFLGALANNIITELHLTPTKFSLIAAAFYIAYGIMQVPVGILADKFGVKICMLFSIAICSAASFLFSTVETFYAAFAYRFMMGFGGAFAFVCLLVTTVNSFPKKNLAMLVGLGQFIGTMGALLAAGPLSTVISKYNVNWRTAFFIIGAFGSFLFILSFIFVKGKKQNHGDYLIFIRKKLPLIKKLKQVINSKQSVLVAIYSSSIFLSVAMLGAVWGISFIQSLGFSYHQAGLIVSFSWLGFAVGCPLLGLISDALVRRKPILVACSFIGLIFICLLVYFPMRYSIIYMLIFFVLGLTSAGQSVGFATITEHVQKHSKSIALGLNSAFITLLAAILPVFIASIIQLKVSKEGVNAHFQYQDFIFAFSFLPLLYVISLCVALFFLDETYCRTRKEMIQVDRNYDDKNE